MPVEVSNVAQKKCRLLFFQIKKNLYPQESLIKDVEAEKWIKEMKMELFKTTAQIVKELLH
jgi:hypothetical protein